MRIIYTCVFCYENYTSEIVPSVEVCSNCWDKYCELVENDSKNREQDERK